MGSPYGILHQRTRRMHMQGHSTPPNTQGASDKQCGPPSYSTNIQPSLSTNSDFIGKNTTDAERISHMVLSAKNGEWERVWEVFHSYIAS